jgi:flagellar biosynthesis protein FlhF
MKIKTYEAPTLEEAYAKMNYEAESLGCETSVVSTRKMLKGGVFGLFGTPVVQLTVAMDEPKKIPDTGTAQVQQQRASEPIGVCAPASLPVTAASSQVDALLEMKRRITGSRLSEFDPSAALPASRIERLPGVLPLIAKQLISQEVDETVVLRLLNDIARNLNERECGDESLVYQYLKDRLSRIMYVAGPIEHREKHLKVVAFVGPTGAGKTTTIAKLAADFTFNQNKRAALITIDTFRIGAIEQLGKYAQIMDLPIEVVATPQDLKCAVNKHSDKDVILIDTAGRSPRDEMNLSGLKGFISVLQPVEVHLVLSAGARDRDSFEIIERFNRICVDRIIFTKLDETTRYGGMVNILDKVNIPVSYLSIGQNVPSDIVIGDAQELSNLIVKNARYAK